MTQSHPPALDAVALAAALRDGEFSATEILHATRRAIDDVGARVGAFVTGAKDASDAMAAEQAAEADRRLAAARRDGTTADLPPFLGVPVPVKDLTMVAGVPFRAGSAALPGDPAPVDAGVVRLLRAAGTVMVGKTTTPELGLPPYTEPDTGPPARTPWDLSRSAGGSSGGAGAAVGSHVVPVAQGSDGGGSIRIPASACGLVGLKPSRGRVSPGPDGVDGAGLAVNGVLTRTVRDTAAFLDVLARPWPGETFTLPRPSDLRPGATFLDACAARPGRLRIGVLTDPVISPDAPVDPQVLEATRQTAELLAELGHDVSPAPLPFPAERWDAFAVLWSTMALSAPIPPEVEHLLTPLTRAQRDAGRGVDGLSVARAFEAVQLITREVARSWESFDVVLTPTLAQPPAPLGSIRDDADPAADFAAQMAYTPWTSVANLTGRPSVSLPLHRAAYDGVELPLGSMLTGRLGDDALLLSLAAQLETALPWATHVPPVHA
ncbi:amidase [Paraoerskovia marina]|uniref:Amidase n=1 Tax=Paraoerskovia marina TaxID=545619 RepID=A0A1H1UTP9_9CELL|nr:amidase [Paraoerskovia marina]SDS75466.1 amidase [Paraoerskovia marina]